VPSEKIDQIKSAIRDIPDFPKPGILFKDITTVLNNAELFRTTVDLMVAEVKNIHPDIIVGIESRGFIFGAAMAYQMNKGFVPIRKPGKLPGKTVSEEYKLEYGVDSVEIHEDAISAGMKVLLVDDLLATGGTALAATKLIEKLGGDVVNILFLVELEFLKGRELIKQYNVKTLISF